MKKLTTKEAGLVFHYSGDVVLEFGDTPLVVSEEIAAVVSDRLGAQVSITDATDDDVKVYVDSLNPGKAAADAQAKADADAAAAATADAQAKADAAAKTTAASTGTANDSGDNKTADTAKQDASQGQAA